MLPVSTLGDPETGGSVAAAGSAEPNHRPAEPGDRATSREMSRGAALDDASRGGSADGFGLRTDHRSGRPVPPRPADCQLSGTGAVGGVERQSATAGPYHQT